MEHKCECKRSKWGDMVIGVYSKDSGCLWFRFWCKHIPGHEGESMPVFSTDPRDALRFAYSDMAEAVKEQIEKDYPSETPYFTTPALFPLSESAHNFFRVLYGPPIEDDTDGDEKPYEENADFEALDTKPLP